MKTTTISNVKEAIIRFKELDEKICHLNDILSLVSWDQKTKAPKKSASIFASAIGTLSTETFKLAISDEMTELLEYLSLDENSAELELEMAAAVRERKAHSRKLAKIPEAMYKEYSILVSRANAVWEEAREKSDFSIFEETLGKIVSYTKKFIELYGYEGHPYNALLEDYEPGLTVEKLDPLFAELRTRSVALLDRLKRKGAEPAVDFLEADYEIEKQKEFNSFIVPKLGFDMAAGRLDESAHPFAQPINTGDVRLTTRYRLNNMRTAIFGTIHESGHGMYEQGINPDYEGTVLREGASFGIHESQSRFYENFIGRSSSFWNHFYPKLQEHFPEQLKDVELDAFCRGINQVAPSFIRVEADELTYNLHIMVRYEIEKGLFDGSIEVKDLPKVWNEKMNEYLGITPPNDSLGVLQDVHWSFGGFGYFPSYSLGNLYAAQIYYTLKKEHPELESFIEKGELSFIREWLRERIHQYGKLFTPNELIVKATGEELNASYLMNYLEEKYSRVYKLNAV
ncbi:carboxypeptidase M32 [Falsibacillus pallidus]|uniref:Metal-dependent carboxypeptidase n=1 Tax=Falsibacillus pallidus TaxID=493781 RepID=A0A370GQC1_9BACI|nr:carboxypeptidase M32 [Falsibacillus pallidus]RDI45912.1 carboxypeptidase Taq [Falsibacillus pallidus]